MHAPAFFRSLRRTPRKLLALLLPIALFLAGWWFGLPPADPHGSMAGASGEIWTCSMHPQIRQPEPGLCPICGMDLIPLTDGGGGGGLREVSVSAEASALLDLRVAPVVRAQASREIRLFGRIAADERLVSSVTSRVPGRLDRLFIAFTGASVKKGDPLAEIYSPDLLVAQRELIEARRGFDALPDNSSSAVSDTRRRLLAAARERLRLLQFSEEQIETIGRLRQPQDHVTLHAPQSGIVTAKLANEGQYVETGDPLLEVADLSSVWLRMEAYENDLQWLREDQEVQFQVEALPGRAFTGKVAFIDPNIDPTRRIAQIRVDVPNEDLLLKPGMFGRASVQTSAPGNKTPDGKSHEPLLVPASSVLRTGERAVVYVRLPERDMPTFEGREIVLGPRAGDQFIVASGLDEGELVVTQGAFKLDSELQIRAKPSMMNRDAGLAEVPAHSADPSLAGQWAPVPRALHRFMENPAPEQLRQLSALVAGVNVVQLQPEELARWQEFSRRLLNDFTIAGEALTSRPGEAVGQVVRAIEQAARHLGLPYAPEVPPPADPAAASAIKQAIEAYLPLSKALADDDDPAAAKAAAALVLVLDALDFPAAARLQELARAVSAAGDIKSRRTAFQPLSDRMIALIREQAIDAVGNAYVVHCPMAFGNQGANWVSDEPAALNPYFGESMLTCGTVTDALSVERPPVAKKPAADPHSGH